MKAVLKFRAFARGRMFGPGYVDDWPDDVPLPKSATEATEAPPPEEKDEGQEQMALSQMSGPKRKKLPS